MDPLTRQALVVALGWLGLGLDFDEAVRDSKSYDEVSPWVLSVVLAVWDSADTQRREVEGKVSGPGLEVVSTALMRLGMGGVFTVVG